jgi:hypothetical protein
MKWFRTTWAEMTWLQFAVLALVGFVLCISGAFLMGGVSLDSARRGAASAIGLNTVFGVRMYFTKRRLRRIPSE